MQVSLASMGLLLACALGCSGIAERRVQEEPGSGGATSDAGATGSGATAATPNAGTSGASASGGAGGTRAQPAAMAGSAGIAGAAIEPAACSDEPSLLPLHALSAWEYGRSVQALTGLSVQQPLLVDGTEHPSGAAALELDTSTLGYLFDEAEHQASQAEQLLGCQVPAQCEFEFIQRFVGAAYGRRLSDAELTRYVSLFKGGANPGMVQGAELVIEAALLSPHFLFQTYLSSDPAGQPERPLDAFELARRLSLALTGALPDDSLRGAAQSGQLESYAAYAAQVERLLQLPAFRENTQHFLASWLGLDELHTLASPDLSPAELAAMRAETEDFLAKAIGDTGTGAGAAGQISRLLGSIAHESEGGILTQRSTLVHFPNPSRRGQFVRERLMCQTVPPSPPNVDTLVKVGPNETRRQAWERHTAPPVCRSCHQLFDPIGFGFESYDELGNYRAEDNGVHVDTSGEVTAVGGELQGTFMGPGALGTMLAGSDEVATCLARTWLAYLLERPLGPADECLVQEISADYAPLGGNLAVLARDIVESHAFRYRDNRPSQSPPPPPFTGSGNGSLQARRKTVLDFVIADGLWYRDQVQLDDKPRVDVYLESLRQLEVQLTQAGPGPTPAP